MNTEWVGKDHLLTYKDWKNRKRPLIFYLHKNDLHCWSMQDRERMGKDSWMPREGMQSWLWSSACQALRKPKVYVYPAETLLRGLKASSFTRAQLYLIWDPTKTTAPLLLEFPWEVNLCRCWRSHIRIQKCWSGHACHLGSWLHHANLAT